MTDEIWPYGNMRESKEGFKDKVNFRGFEWGQNLPVKERNSKIVTQIIWNNLISLRRLGKKEEGVGLPLRGQVEEPLPEEERPTEQPEERCGVYQSRPEKLCTQKLWRKKKSGQSHKESENRYKHSKAHAEGFEFAKQVKEARGSIKRRNKKKEILSKRTRRGQPNLSLQMEYLLLQKKKKQ